jgi:multidrug efflux pump subunit AcrA (membrane-fusion protein)
MIEPRALVVLLVFGASSLACSSMRPSDSGPALIVERGEIVVPFLLTGELEADTALVLSAPRTETFELSIQWIAEDGAAVEKGARLVEFDDTSLLDSISDHEIQVQQADNDLTNLRAQQAVEVAEKRFATRQAGIEVGKAEIDATVPEHIVSRLKYSEYQLALGRAELLRDAASEDSNVAQRGATLQEQVQALVYEKAERSYEAANAQIKSMTILAPQAGVMIVPENPFEGRKLQIGDKVFPGFTVAKLPDLSKMIVRAVLSDVDDGRVHPGMKVSCVLDAYPERVFPGLVRSVSPVAREPERSSTRRFFSVVVELDETDPSIMRPGLSVKAQVEGLRRESLLIPRAVLRYTADGVVAYDTSGDPIDVEIGACNAHHCELRSGLDEGAELAVPPSALDHLNHLSQEPDS